MARQLERMVTNPEASGDYLLSLAKVGVGAAATGAALGFGVWAARSTSETAEEVAQEGSSGLAFGGGL